METGRTKLHRSLRSEAFSGKAQFAEPEAVSGRQFGRVKNSGDQLLLRVAH